LEAALHAPLLVAQKRVDLKFIDAGVEAVHALRGVVVGRDQKIFSGLGDGLIWRKFEGLLRLRVEAHFYFNALKVKT
jgi:tetrahydromethanopterin S-methyltransferase subunit F